MIKKKQKSIQKANRQPPVIASLYSYWFYLPAIVVFGIFFLIPTVLAFYFIGFLFQFDPMDII
jgi:hypothetical protein